MKRFFAVICLALLATSAARAETPTSQPVMRHMTLKELAALIPAEAKSRPGRNYVTARKVSTPGYDAMRKYYPASAKAIGQRGVALLECQFDAMGNLLNCDILAERPETYGFGASTIDLVQKYFTLDMRNFEGKPNADWIKLMVRWP